MFKFSQVCYFVRWDAPSEKTGLWQLLPKVSSVFMLLSHLGEYAGECAYERKYLTIAQTSQHSPQIHYVHKSFSTSLRRSVTIFCSHTANMLANMLSEGNIWQSLKLRNIRRVFVSVGNKFGKFTNYSPSPPYEDRSIYKPVCKFQRMLRRRSFGVPFVSIGNVGKACVSVCNIVKALASVGKHS